MNVIILNDFAYVNGGASQIALKTARSLAQKGVQTVLFTGMGPLSPELLKQEKLHVICLNQYDILTDPNRFRAIYQGIWNRAAAQRFVMTLRRYDPHDTIIHVHTCQKVLSSSCVHAAKRLGFRVIYHLHDYGAICPNLGFYDYQKNEVCCRIPMSSACILSHCDARKYSHKLWRVVRQFVQKRWGGIPCSVDAFIAVSSFSWNILRPFFPPSTIIKVLPNPCEIEKNPLIAPEKNKYFLYLGRVAPEKNPVEFAECARDLNLPALFIGDGPYLDKVKQVYPQAVFTGWLEKDKLYDHIKNVRCLVFPSALYETQGLSVQELAAFGIPSIVSDVCAAKEMIVHGVNGLIYKSRDKAELKDCLSKMMDDMTVKNMGRRAYEIVEQQAVSDEVYLDELLTFYDSILSSSNV